MTLHTSNKNSLFRLLVEMENNQDFSEEEIFLVTDSINSMTEVIDLLDKGEISSTDAELRFKIIQANLDGRLGNQVRSRVRIYAGENHPHEAQNPIPLEV